MGFCVCGGATLECPFGTSPSALLVTPEKKVVSNMPLATVDANKPFVNIMPFGACGSMGNPMVASATAAAYGVLQRVPCLPVISAPWTPGSPTVLIGGTLALNQASKLFCSWGGVIQVVNPGTVNIQVP